MKHVHRFGTMIIFILVAYNIKANPNDEAIYYPPRKDTVSIEDIRQNWDSLVVNTIDLKNKVESDICKHGIINSMWNHSGFYGAIMIYTLLLFLHRKNRRR